MVGSWAVGGDIFAWICLCSCSRCNFFHVVSVRIDGGEPLNEMLNLSSTNAPVYSHIRFVTFPQSSATAIIFSAAVLGMLWALLQFLIITRIPVRSEGVSDSTGLVSGSNDESTTRRLVEIYTAIYEGAESFLRAEYSICARFIVVFGILIFVLVSWGTGWDFARGLFTTLSFVLGAATSIREFIAAPPLVLLNSPKFATHKNTRRQTNNNTVLHKKHQCLVTSE